MSIDGTAASKAAEIFAERLAQAFVEYLLNCREAGVSDVVVYASSIPIIAYRAGSNAALLRMVAAHENGDTIMQRLMTGFLDGQFDTGAKAAGLGPSHGTRQ